MTIAAITESLSTPRFSTYQLPILGGTSPEQCLGIYLWNKQLASAFLPALQIVEISLRNAIYQSWVAYEEDRIERNFAQHAWATKKSQVDKLWFVNVFTEQNNPIAWSNIKTARKQLLKDGKPLTAENYISKLTLGFWVSLIRNDFDIQHHSYLTLWPHLRTRVFPNAVNSSTGVALSINSIGNELKDINKIRNRLSHHEPLWRNTQAYQIEDIINKVVEHYERCLKVIHWINPSNLKLLDIIESNNRMAELCSMHTIWKNKQLPAGISTLPVKTDWSDGVKINSEHTGLIVKVSASNVMIKSDKDQAIFYGAAKSMESGIGNYAPSDKVRFQPEKGQGKYPNAKKIVKI
ncbi:Abi family protein [Serratia fonticola]|uniref:Abi family protein n=1 Tax=Serratia fonticola TaxID=47917 RepID=UPI001376DC33|nr:Abi family protein [Serratia fonticola]NCG53671.1 Abi family protein [Serratia fonticola]